jgi:hypothetical protein
LLGNLGHGFRKTIHAGAHDLDRKLARVLNQRVF